MSVGASASCGICACGARAYGEINRAELDRLGRCQRCFRWAWLEGDASIRESQVRNAGGGGSSSESRHRPRIRSACDCCSDGGHLLPLQGAARRASWARLARVTLRTPGGLGRSTRGCQRPPSSLPRAKVHSQRLSLVRPRTCPAQPLLGESRRATRRGCLIKYRVRDGGATAER